jgi:hypothetical protein
MAAAIWLLDEPVIGGHNVHNDPQGQRGTTAAAAEATPLPQLLYQKPAVNQRLGGQIGAAQEVADGGQELGEEEGDGGGQKEVLSEQVHEGEDQHLPHREGELLSVQQHAGEGVAWDDTCSCRKHGRYFVHCTVV